MIFKINKKYMFCEKCGKNISNDSKFCEFCSAEVRNINQISNPKIREGLLNKKAFHFWLLYIATALLVIAMFSFPQQSTANEQSSGFSFQYPISSDFSKFILICIFCISLYFAFLKYKDKRLDIVFLFVLVGIIFNPFFSFNFGNDFQNVIEFFTAVFFGYFSYKEYQKLKNDPNPPQH